MPGMRISGTESVERCDCASARFLTSLCSQTIAVHKGERRVGRKIATKLKHKLGCLWLQTRLQEAELEVAELSAELRTLHMKKVETC
jgi:hypothetical protein